MIIACASCGQRYSNKAAQCPGCKLPTAGHSAAGEHVTEAAANHAMRRARRRRQNLINQGLMAIIVTIAGTVWVFHVSAGWSRAVSYWDSLAMVLGMVWYAAVRAQLLYLSWRARQRPG